MQMKKQFTDSTHVVLTLSGDPEVLAAAKSAALTELSSSVKVQGFRNGKIPPAILEKHIKPTLLQSEFLDRAVNAMYVDAVEQEKLHPVARPEVSVKKFVPYEVVEAEFIVEVVGEIKLG